jgi:LPS O-antigen subunit length determinant protein (WzzB/FepE family)
MSDVDWYGTFTLWSQIGTIIAAFAAVIALCLNYKALKENSKTRELQLFDQIFSKIIALEDQYYREYANKTPEEIKNWLSLFLNTLEFKAFLINNNYLKKEFIDFYRDAFIAYYKNIFLKYVPDKDQKDQNKYQEIKKLYNFLQTQ